MKYSFPLLSEKEVLLCLEELQIPFTKEDLAQPKSDVVQAAFETCVELLMGVSREELSQPVLEALDAFSYPDLAENATGGIAMMKKMTKLMLTCGVHDFSFRDVLRPESKRLRRIFSGVINFAKFREERLVSYEKYTQELDAEIDRQQELQVVNSDVTARLDEIKAQRAEEEPEVKDLEGETAEMLEEINECNRQQASLQNSIRDIKDRVQKASDSIATSKYNTLTANQECDKLREQIIEDPEGLKQTLADLSDALSRESDIVEEQRRKKLATKSSLAAATSTLQDLETLTTDGAEATESWKKLSATKDEVAQANARVKALENEVAEHEQNLALLQRQMAQMESKGDRARTQARARLEAAQNALQHARAMLRDAREETKDEEDKTAEHEGQARALRELSTNALQSHTREMIVLKEHSERLLEQVNSYHANLEDYIQ